MDLRYFSELLFCGVRLLPRPEHQRQLKKASQTVNSRVFVSSCLYYISFWKSSSQILQSGRVRGPKFSLLCRLECSTCGWESRAAAGSSGRGLDQPGKTPRTRTRSRGSGVVVVQADPRKRKKETVRRSFRPPRSPRQRALRPDAINRSHDTNGSGAGREKEMLPREEERGQFLRAWGHISHVSLHIRLWGKQKSWMGHWYE